MSTVSGLRRYVRHFLEDKIDTEDLRRALETPITYPPLAVTSLGLAEIKKILGLTQTTDDEFESVKPVPVPQDLKTWLEKSDRAHSAGRDNEAMVRCKLNLLLLYAHDLVSSSSDNTENLLNIRMERTWAYSPVRWKGEIWMLTGRPDYGIWYGEEEDLELKVVVMEAKKPLHGGAGMQQALAYMACIHKQRKDIGKADTTVYGISSDTLQFTFIKLDNESRWSFTPFPVQDNDFDRVLGVLVYLMKKASISPVASKRTSHQGSGGIDLIFDYHPEIDDDDMDAETMF